MFSRWFVVLQSFDMVVEHVPGVDNIVADAMSRSPFIETPVERAGASVVTDPIVVTQDTGVDASILYLKLEDASPTDTFFRAALRCAEGDNPKDWPANDEHAEWKRHLLRLLAKGGRLIIGSDNRLRVIENLSRSRIVPPDSEWTALLRSFHDDSLVGHPGAQRTLEALAQRFFWPTMARDVTNFVASCDRCQKAKHGPTADVVMHPLEVVPPWHTVQLDLLSMTQSARGHLYILTLRDCGSHFVHLEALFTKSALEVSNAVLSLFAFTASLPNC